MLITCEKCSSYSSEDATFCNSCGHSLSLQKIQKKQAELMENDPKLKKHVAFQMAQEQLGIKGANG